MTKSVGRVVVLTGPGKGKSSSAFGMVFRAAGWGMRVLVIQFIKGKWKTGEEMAAARFDNIEWHALGEGFTWESEDPERDRSTCRAAWALSCERIRSGLYDMVVLDEINYAIGFGWISGEECADFIQKEKPASLHLILTGRDAPGPLLAIADIVTVMGEEKHLFYDGGKAVRGVEF
ncbi:MAG: cob(I)yrinic acid a,c-diamide adenosyltransferase [Magnetococcales bacterium]|nr:cob(I)yrinic acid a,c-diamide adenosyltransferase [Magnetococcales bacterium]